MLIALLGVAAAQLVAPDGLRLRADTACYALTGPDDRVIGATWQTLRPERMAGRRVWRIVVHQHMADGSFDLRDEFVLDARRLAPISLVTTRAGAPHAELSYAEGRVTGFAVDGDGERRPIDQPLPSPVWDGDLYGPTFAALPLKLGARFTLPFYQYDRGLGEFTVTVTGTATIDTPDGKVDAWVLDAGPSDKERVTYWIARRTRREIGYRVAQGGQRLGGDCAGLR